MCVCVCVCDSLQLGRALRHSSNYRDDKPSVNKETERERGVEREGEKERCRARGGTERQSERQRERDKGGERRRKMSKE